MNNIFKVASVLMVLACCGCQNSASSDHVDDGPRYPYVKDRGVRHKPDNPNFHLERCYDRRLKHIPRALVIDRYSKDWYALNQYIDKENKIHRVSYPPHANGGPSISAYDIAWVLDIGDDLIYINNDYKLHIACVSEKNEQLFIKELKRIINNIAVKEPAWLPVKHDEDE